MIVARRHENLAEIRGRGVGSVTDELPGEDFAAPLQCRRTAVAATITLTVHCGHSVWGFCVAIVWHGFITFAGLSDGNANRGPESGTREGRRQALHHR